MCLCGMARCIPFRSNGEDPESIEVLMVTRGCGEGLVFPKVTSPKC